MRHSEKTRNVRMCLILMHVRVCVCLLARCDCAILILCSLEENTTQLLVADMELLREKLGVDRWVVFGQTHISFMISSAAPELTRCVNCYSDVPQLHHIQSSLCVRSETHPSSRADCL